MPDKAHQTGVLKPAARVASYSVLALMLTILCAWVPAWWSTTGTFAAVVMSDPSDPTDPAGIWRGRVPVDWDARPLSTTTVGIARPAPNGVRMVGTRLRYVQGDHVGVSVGASGTTLHTTGAGRLLDRYEIGWPWKTMTALGPDDNRPNASAGIARWYAHGIPVPAFGPLGTKAGRTLPLRPLWGAFTLMFAAWLGVLVLAVLAWKSPGRIRRGRRQRRGLCLACGYDIEGIDICPECSTPREARSARV